MWSIITSLLPSLIPGIVDIIKRIVPDPAQQAEAQKQIIELVNKAQNDVITASKEVMIADAQQDDNFTKRARPMIVYWSMSVTTFIILLSLVGYSEPVVVALKQVPDMLWTLMTAGVGLFTLGRSIEKGIGSLKK